MTKVFLIGGPGNISRGTLDYLLERGYDLAVYARHAAQKRSARPKIAFYEGDRRDAETLRHAFSDFGAELVIDTICFELAEARALYEITRGKIRHLLFLSAVDVYGYPLSRLPFREQDEFRPALGEYAQKKRAIELFYEDKWQKEGFPVTLGRPSLSIGPDFCPMTFWDWGLRTVPKMKAAGNHRTLSRRARDWDDLPPISRQHGFFARSLPAGLPRLPLAALAPGRGGVHRGQRTPRRVPLA